MFFTHGGGLRRTDVCDFSISLEQDRLPAARHPRRRTRPIPQKHATMKNILLRMAVSLATVAAMTGCSLLKVSLSTGEPISPDDARVRVMTRALYYDLSNRIVAAADSVATSPDTDMRIRAIRWKIRATRAAVTAAMQSIPDVALADTWIFCTRMDRAFTHMPDSMLFGPYTPMMRTAVHDMRLKTDSVARQALTADRYALMQEYVEQYIRRNRQRTDENTTPQNTTLAWIEFMKSKGIEVTYDSGSIADVVSDMSDKMNGQTGQFTNSLIWSKDILEIEWQRDSMSQYVSAQLDSLDRSFERIVIVMENIPEISDSVMARFNTHVEQVLASLESSLDYAFAQVDMQRSELQRYVSAEREAIIKQAGETAQGIVQQAIDQVPAIVSRVAVWLVLLAVVVLGLPFAAGYWVGTLRERARRTAPPGDRPEQEKKGPQQGK